MLNHFMFINHASLQVFKKFCISTISYKKLFLPTFFTFGFHSNETTENQQKTNRYWLIENIGALLEEADKLYYEENYIEVYETLNRLKYQDNIEVQWRICRALYKLSSVEEKQKSVKESMMEEAYTLITKTIEMNENHSEAHKWLAIILDYKSSLEGYYSRVQTSPTVYEHLQKSLELNPDDPALLYMMGIWCYEISKMTWITKQIAKYIFHLPKPTTTEEAYKYFLKAEQLKPRFFLGNIYMLGLCSYDLGMFFRARYYLKIAADLPIKSDLERRFSERAKKLAHMLQKFEVGVDALF